MAYVYGVIQGGVKFAGRQVSRKQIREFAMQAIETRARLEKLHLQGIKLTATKNGREVKIDLDGKQVDVFTYLGLDPL